MHPTMSTTKDNAKSPKDETAATQTRVLIIRHGEKPGDPAAESAVDGRELSPRGVERAAALATYIPRTFGAPDFLFATQQSKHSNRPVETITPLSQAVGVEINDKHADDDYQKVADDILGHPKYAGKLILICWHHGKIPKLTSALGGIPPQNHWPDTVFDRVWSLEISVPPATGIPAQNLPQNLLPEDSD